MAEQLSVGSADLSKLEIRLVGGEKSEAEDKKRLPESRKVVELKDAVEEVESCSACYGYLIPALAMLKDEGLFGKLHEKISRATGEKKGLSAWETARESLLIPVQAARRQSRKSMNF